MNRRQTVTLASLAFVTLTGAAFAQAVQDPDVDFASELFDLRAGSWQQKVTVDGEPAPTSMQMCVDDSVVYLASLIASRTLLPLGDAGCKLADAATERGQARFTIACVREAQPPTQIAAAVTRDSADGYTLDAMLTSGSNNKQMKMSLRRVGACSAGQSPGDMTATMGDKLVKLPTMRALLEANGNVER